MSSVWDGARFVIIDTETTGLHERARILSVAVYCLENGATVESWSTLVNPGEFGAVNIHGLDPKKLARAKPFAVHADHLRDLLTITSGTVYLVAHNIGYDATRLAFEYSLLGQELPPLVLLDTLDLARAAGVVVPGRNLDALASAFGLAAVAKHEANADALVVREVALRCLATLDASNSHDLVSLATDPSATPAAPSAPRPALTVEHAELHDLPMRTATERQAALAGCLELSCPDLHKRIEDGITNPASARACYQWVLAAMADTSLTRFQRGLLTAGAARALAGWRNTTTKPNHSLLFTKAVAVLAACPGWQRCDGTDLCDHCQDGKPDRCRFVTSPRRLLRAAVYTTANTLPTVNATAYLAGDAKTPLTGKSGWARVHALAPDAADGFVVTLARDLRQHGRTDLARPAVVKLWKTSVRTPYLTTTYAAIVEDDKATRDKLTVFREAEAICVDGLAATTSADKDAWKDVEARLGRLRGRINAATKKPPAAPYNTRPAHRSRFVRP
jgi:DNA polymerase III epsilon subunit-like protein